MRKFEIFQHFNFSVSMSTESPVQVKQPGQVSKTPVSAKKHRRKLFLSSEKNQTDTKSKLDESFEGTFFYHHFDII